MKLIIDFFNLKWRYLFTIIIGCYFLIVWLSHSVLVNDVVFYNSYSEQLSYERSLKLFNEINRLSWINYVFLPIMLFLKCALVSTVLYTGIFFCDISKEISFSTVFRIVTASEIIFVLAGITKFLWFFLFAGNYDLNDMSFFYPLSLINLFDRSEVREFWVFPLQSVNVFQMLYILLLSFGLNKAGAIGKQKSEKVVIRSYMPALLFWVVLIMFLSIDASL